MSEVELPFLIPLPRRFTTLSDTVPVGREDFLRHAALAADTLPDATYGTRWALDGHTSEELFLRLPCGHVVDWPHLDVSFGVQFDARATRVRVHSERPADLALFLRFVAAVRAELLCA